VDHILTNVIDPIVSAKKFAWQENVTRDLYVYVRPDKNTTIISPPVCSTPLLLLVVVCTRADLRLKRDSIRDTWGAVPDGVSARVVFLLGLTRNVSLQVTKASDL
jgi:hypothetical protein